MKYPTPFLHCMAGLMLASAVNLVAQDAEPAPPPPPPPPVAPTVAPPPQKAPAAARSIGAANSGRRMAILREEVIDSDDLGVEEVKARALSRVGEDFALIQSKPGRAGRSLVVPSKAPDAKAVAETEEDLNVMARILEKAAGAKRSKSGRAMGISVDASLFGAPSPARNLYVEGHGAIFLLNVPYPLVPPPPKPEKKEPAKEPEDSEWEAARSEVYGTGARVGGMVEVLRTGRNGAGEPQPEYDANKVENLKADLTEALKNVAHLRRMKPDETVTVVVSGGGSGGPDRAGQRVMIYSSGGGYAGGAGGGGAGVAGGPATTGTMAIDGPAMQAKRGESTMVLRAAKADAEAYQSGKLDFEGFAKKVSVLLY